MTDPRHEFTTVGAEVPPVTMSVPDHNHTRQAPDGRLEGVADAGHLVPIDQPKAFVDLVASFLERT